MRLIGGVFLMTDSEFIEQLTDICAKYCEDTDHWADYFMEQVIDLVNEYTRR